MSSDPVVIIAPEHDWHGRVVRERLQAMGVAVVVLDTRRFPDQLRISLGEQLDDVEIDGRPLTPGSIYVRDLALNPGGPSVDVDGGMRTDWRRTLAGLHERSDFVMSLVYRWEAAGVPVYNPLSTAPRITKPYQMALLAAAGLPVPATSWTNDPDRVRRVAERGRLIYKPIAGGAATRELAERDLADSRLELLRSAPVCFQELLPGTDLRIYVLDGEVVASIRIETDTIDFRGHERALVALSLDDGLRDICVRAAAVLGLRFTGMDVKLDAHGEPRILELNASPMFVGFDQRAGTDIVGSLCEALVMNTSRCGTRRTRGESGRWASPGCAGGRP